MKKTADVIVVGQGVYGLSITYHLAKRGVDVVCLDRVGWPHSGGSSHGQSRITRCAIGENPDLSPYAIRSHEIWSELESELGVELFRKTGGLFIGKADGSSCFHGRRDFVGITIAAAQKYNIDHHTLSADDIRREFPLFNVQDGDVGYYEPGAGALFPERCLLALQAASERRGAIHHGQTRVESIKQVGDSVILATSQGEMSAGRSVIAAGPWVKNFLPENYRRHFKIIRQIMFWFVVEDRPERFHVGRFPVFISESNGIYGFPALFDNKVKVALGERDGEADPNRAQSVSDAEWDAIEATLGRTIRSFQGVRVGAALCPYTQTPDRNFVIDRHPEMSNAWIVSACSGHGFKHSAAIGELVAEIVYPSNCNDEPNLTEFSLARFK